MLDAFDELNGRGGTCYRGQHKTQRCARVFVVVDLQNLTGSTEPFNQCIEVLPVVETVNFEPNRYQSVLHTSMICRESIGRWCSRMEKSDEVLEPISISHGAFSRVLHQPLA